MTTETQDQTTQDEQTQGSEDGAKSASEKPTKGTDSKTSAGNGDGAKGSDSVPLGTFKEVERQLKADRKRLQEYEAKDKEREDAAAVTANDVTKFKGERDQFEGEAKQWREYATAKIANIEKDLDEDAQAILDELGDETPLAKRLSIAERLAASTKPESKGAFGSSGGKGKSADAGGLIPSSITSWREYQEWYANLSTSRDKEDLELLQDAKKRATIQAEARERFQ